MLLKDVLFSFTEQWYTALHSMIAVTWTIEMIAKITTYGLWFGRDAYFRSGWNINDMIAVLSMWLWYEDFVRFPEWLVTLLHCTVPLRLLSALPAQRLIFQVRPAV